MKWLAALLFWLPLQLPAATGAAAELADRIREAGLDSSECYRVRELDFAKEDVHFYFTDGYVIFGKPVDGRRYSAVFAAEVDAGDAEVLAFPPSRSERLSLARATGSPNLSEHFKLAAMIYSDDTYEVLSKRIREAGEPRNSPERGVLLADAWASMVRNLTASLETRLVRDLFSSRGPSAGLFYAGIAGERLGNFDLLYDPRARQQIVVGALRLRGNQPYFDVWTSFESLSFRKGLRASPSQEYGLSNYRLNATLQPDLTLKVTTQVTVTPTEDEGKVLRLNLSPRMRLTAASINGAPVEFFQRDAMRENLIRGGDAVFLLLPGFPLERGKSYELEFQNEGAVIHSAGNDVYYVSSRENWYPSNSAGFSQYEVTFRYPKNLDLVVAGEPVDEATEGDWKIVRRRFSNPVRLLGFNLGNYQHVSVARDPYRIEVYANKKIEPGLQPKPKPAEIPPPQSPGWASSRGMPTRVSPELWFPPSEPRSEPPDPTARLRQLASEIAGAFEFMTAKFGPPAVASLTVSPIPGSLGQGFPGLLYLPTFFYLDPAQRPVFPRSDLDQTLLSEVLYAHEVAHQWWGNVVAPASEQDIWVMEALANYSALLYVEQRSGPKAVDTILGVFKKRLLAPVAEGRTLESMGPITWGARLQSSQAPDAWRAITYDKGSWIMHMLRRRLGDERFLAMLGELAKRYRHATLASEQFRALAAEFLPKGSVDPTLETFFENWVYSTGIPTLRMEYSTKGKAPAIKVSGRLSQSEVDEGFSAWVPVQVQLSGGKSLTQWVRTDSEPVSFSVALKQAPLKVLLDPAESVLAVRK